MGPEVDDDRRIIALDRQAFDSTVQAGGSY
jgi:hypothetical protein